MKQILFILVFILTTCLPVCAINADEKLLDEQNKEEGTSLVANIQNIGTELRQGKIGSIADICVSLTTLIICVGAICVIATKTINAAMKGEVIELKTLAMPFIFAIVISSYQPLTQGVDWIIGGFDGLMASLSEDSLHEIEEKRKIKSNLIDEIEKKIEEMENTSMWDSIKIAISNALSSLKSWATYNLVQILAYCASLLTRLLGSVLCIILYMIGPLAIALSVIPAFADNWKNWLGKYIWVQLFTPVCRIISWVLQEIELIVLNKDITRLEYCLNNIEKTKGGIEISGGGFMEGTAYLAFMITGAILYICVPSIASWIVNTSGGGVMTGMNAMGTMMMGKASKAGKSTINRSYQGANKGARYVGNKIKDVLKNI